MTKTSHKPISIWLLPEWLKEATMISFDGFHSTEDSFQIQLQFKKAQLEEHLTVKAIGKMKQMVSEDGVALLHGFWSNSTELR